MDPRYQSLHQILFHPVLVTWQLEAATQPVAVTQTAQQQLWLNGAYQRASALMRLMIRLSCLSVSALTEPWLEESKTCKTAWRSTGKISGLCSVFQLKVTERQSVHLFQLRHNSQTLLISMLHCPCLKLSPSDYLTRLSITQQVKVSKAIMLTSLCKDIRVVEFSI